MRTGMSRMPFISFHTLLLVMSSSLTLRASIFSSVKYGTMEHRTALSKKKKKKKNSPLYHVSPLRWGHYRDDTEKESHTVLTGI